MLTCSQGRF